ncbi:MAG: polyprenyl synthetase family protein [Streptococcaceae bacterium]|nr:polyprenyl synthetase family protein [Streptococcaceae bacterium]
MWKSYPKLKRELTQTKQLMTKTLRIKNKAVESAVLEMLNQGGKMLRPAYQLLFSEFGTPDADKKIALAAAIEMLHTATLIHDDIVDKSTTRRGLPSIAHQFGEDVAVYAGDYLFVTTFKLMANYTDSLKSLQLHSDSMEKILDGELGQMNFRYNLKQTAADYLSNISGKTAELFSLSCAIGAIESSTSHLLASQARDIGKNVGIAFQIIDDYLDYTQTEQVIGKPVLEDMKQGVYSLPLLLALETKLVTLAPILNKREAMTDYDATRVEKIIRETNALDKTKEIALEYTNQALKIIQKLPKNAENTKQTLNDITTQLIERIR